MEYNSLETGQTYKLQDLFSKDNKIIIPDLQRDYCWGTTNDKEGKNLVERFIDNLIENKDKELNLGLLYGYEAPLGHIQLCDGQQRITTLFLLLGMLNKKTYDKFRRFLISEEEEKDDWEPYLQYSIRESSLYFLSDLTRSFFIENKNLSVSDIKMQPWYFKDYDLDPSIKSMIAAMGIIESKIQDINCEIFGEHITKQLSFLYYDMGNRTKGEETFVVINTTGEPLSPTENLKPLLIGRQPKEEQDECAQKWETWEQFFWKYRGKNDTADNGLKEFFRWIMLLHLDVQSEKFKQIQDTGTYMFDKNILIDEIDRYFQIVSTQLFGMEAPIFNEKEWLSPEIKGNDQVNLFKLIPILEYIKRFPEATDRDVKRVKMFFQNLTLIPNVSKAISVVFPEAIRIVKELPNKDICSVLDLERVSKVLLSEETKMKLEIYRKSEIRDEIEDLFWEAEEHPYTQGCIKCILTDIFNKPIIPWDKQNLDYFKLRLSIFKLVFSEGNTSILLSTPPKEGEIDNSIIARTILACNKDHGCHVNSLNYCYGYKDYWAKIISDKPECLFTLIDNLILPFEQLSMSSLYTKMKEIINNYLQEYSNKKEEQGSKYYIVKYPNSLQSINDGYNILYFCDDDWDYWIDILNKTTRNSYHINLFVYLVYKQLKDDERKNVENQWLVMKNGIQLDCGKDHEWIIKKADNTPISTEIYEKISKKLSSKYPMDNGQNFIVINIDKKDDFIEQGINILKEVSELEL